FLISRAQHLESGQVAPDLLLMAVLVLAIRLAGGLVRRRLLSSRPQQSALTARGQRDPWGGWAPSARRQQTKQQTGGRPVDPTIVGANIDTWILTVKGELPVEVADALDRLKQASQEADEDVPTPWTFDDQALFIKAHGSGRQWRWILHCPSLH